MKIKKIQKKVITKVMAVTVFFMAIMFILFLMFRDPVKPTLTPKKDEQLERQTQRALFLAQHPEEKKKTLEGRKQLRY